MSQAAITLIVLVVAIILFVIDILPMGLVAFCVPVVLYFLGIIEVGDIFTGSPRSRDASRRQRGPAPDPGSAART